MFLVRKRSFYVGVIRDAPGMLKFLITYYRYFYI